MLGIIVLALLMILIIILCWRIFSNTRPKKGSYEKMPEKMPRTIPQKIPRTIPQKMPRTIPQKIHEKIREDKKQRPVKLPLKQDVKLRVNPEFKRKDKYGEITKFYKDMSLLHDTTPVIYTKGFNICTLNVHYFASINMDDTKRDCIAGCIDLFKKYNLDVLCLQEVYNEHVPMLKKLRPDLYYSWDDFEKTNFISGHRIINLVISRHPLINVEKHMLKTSPNMERNRRHIILFSVDKPGYENIKMATTHFEIHGSHNRRKQISHVFELAPDIILGDFNLNTKSKEYKIITKEYTSILDKNQESNKNYTVPFGTVVDFVFIKKELVKKFEKKSHILNYKYSDHRPVYTNLQFASGS